MINGAQETMLHSSLAIQVAPTEPKTRMCHCFYKQETPTELKWESKENIAFDSVGQDLKEYALVEH